MLATQPHDIERAVVIRVMPLKWDDS